MTQNEFDNIIKDLHSRMLQCKENTETLFGQSDKLPVFLKPTLKLFLSVDLIGSTALKQKKSIKLVTEKSPPNVRPEQDHDENNGSPNFRSRWGHTFNLIYRKFVKPFNNEIPSEIPEQNKDEPKRCSSSSWVDIILFFFSAINESFINFNYLENPKRTTNSSFPKFPSSPAFFKGNGDEAVFELDLLSANQAYYAIQTFIMAGRRVRNEIQSHGLDLKLNAWTAFFPTVNSRIALPSFQAPATLQIPDIKDRLLLENILNLEMAHRKTNMTGLDYVGPSMDTGFRLSTLATSRRMPISIELAHILANTHDKGRSQFGGEELRVFFSGRRDLKGVLAGEGYPHFWLDSWNHQDNEIIKLEDTFMKENQLDWNDVNKYCELFIKQQQDYLIMAYPYIDNDPDNLFNSYQPLGDQHLSNLQMKLDNALAIVDKLLNHPPSATPLNIKGAAT